MNRPNVFCFKLILQWSFTGNVLTFPKNLLLMSCFYVSWTILTGLPRKTDWVLEQWQEIKSRSLFDFRTLLTSIPRLINKSIKIVKLNLTVLYYSVVIRIQIFLPQKRKQQFPFKAKHGFSCPLTLNFSTNNKKSNRKTQAKYPLVIN